MKKPNGVILFEGASVLDGAPIVAIATLANANRKIGNMVQTWILRSDIDPVTASKNGGDLSICGVCPQRQAIGGSCYVNIGQAPGSIYKAYKAGKYPHFDNALHGRYIEKRMIRLGAYGDPAAVPASIWADFVALGRGHTGYTHQLQHKNWQPAIGELCMISTETEKRSIIATDNGLSTFRIKSADQPLLAGEIECLADTQGLSCEACGICNATGQSVAITVHGILAKRYKAA